MRKLSIVAAVLALFSVTLATRVEAQTGIDSAWAQQFVGDWDVKLETPDGEMPLVLTVREDAGNVVVVLGQGGPEGQSITDVRRSGDALVAMYDLDYQGMPINAVLTMSRAGEGLQTSWSFADGMYETASAATRR